MSVGLKIVGPFFLVFFFSLSWCFGWINPFPATPSCWKHKCPLPFYYIIFLSKHALEGTLLCSDKGCSHHPGLALLLKASL
jgi:hypothetical protein